MTTNITKRFCSQNIYWLQYLSTNKYKREHNPIIKYPEEYTIDRNTFIANTIYHRAYKELQYKTKIPYTHKIFKHTYLDIIWVYSVEMYSDGSWRIDIYSSGTKTGHFSLLPFIIKDNISIVFEGKLEEKNYRKAVEKAIEKHLYPEGYWRELQLEQYCNKEKVKEWYRDYILCHRENKPIAYLESDISKWLLRNHNIDIGLFNLYDKKVIEKIKRIKKPKEIVTLRRFDYSFMDTFDGTIDEAEKFINEEMDQYPKNTIFI